MKTHSPFFSSSPTHILRVDQWHALYVYNFIIFSKPWGSFLFNNWGSRGTCSCEWWTWDENSLTTVPTTSPRERTSWSKRHVPLVFCLFGADVKNLPANAGDAGNAGSIPGVARSHGIGNDNLLQYSCWKIPWTEESGSLQSMRSQTRLSNWARAAEMRTPVSAYRWQQCSLEEGALAFLENSLYSDQQSEVFPATSQPFGHLST